MRDHRRASRTREAQAGTNSRTVPLLLQPPCPGGETPFASSGPGLGPHPARDLRAGGADPHGRSAKDHGRRHDRTRRTGTTEGPPVIRVTTATIRPESDRYQTWMKVFGSDTVPLLTPWPRTLRGPNGKALEFYMLDVAALDDQQRERMIDDLVDRFDVARE